MEKNKSLNNIIKVIAKISLFATAGIFLLSALMATFTKMDIEGSIYKTNTTREERELMWEAEFKKRYKNYDESTESKDYEDKLQVSSYLNLLYKYTYVNTNPTDATKELRLEIYNNSENAVMSMSSIEIEDWYDEIVVYTIDANERILFSKGTETYTLTVPLDFDIDDYSIIATNVKYDNYTYSSRYITSYEDELEYTKYTQITLTIENEIGPRPTEEYETQEPIPAYMEDINDNFAVCVILYVMTIIFAGFGFMLRKKQNKPSNVEFTTADSNNFGNSLNANTVSDNQNNNSMADLKQELKAKIKHIFS